MGAMTRCPDQAGDNPDQSTREGERGTRHQAVLRGTARDMFDEATMGAEMA